MNKILEKIIAVLLIITLAGANLAILGMYSISYALTDTELSEQTTDTKNSNVEFNSYFEGGEHIKTESIDSTTAKLFVNVKVKNAGYLKNAEISFEEVNFKLGNVKSDQVQSVDKENNKIVLKQLNNGSDVTIEIPISILNDSSVPMYNFSKESKTIFTGKYIDAKGNENAVSKEIVNKLSWSGEAEALVEGSLTTYVPYATGEKYGVMVQTKVNSGIVDSKLPIKKTEVQVEVPQINGQKPTTVNVIATGTKATNGATDGVDFSTENYEYNNETGIVKIHTSNVTDKIEWEKAAKDEYLVTFIFDGKEIYEYAKTNGVDTSAKVKVNIEAYNNVEKVLEEKSTVVPIKETEKVGTVADFDILVEKSISKGQIYANYEATNKKETEYSVRYVSTVNSAELTESIQFTQQLDKFLTSEDEEGSTTVSGKNYAYNKKVVVSQRVFNKILGEEGSITVLNADKTEIGTINKETKLAEKNYILDISKANSNQLIITTSKPITEGQLVVDVQKAIKTDMEYSKSQMKEFTKIEMALEGKAATSTVNAMKQMLLKETTSVAGVSISKTNLTTVVKNENVEIRATLDTSDLYNALYKNPTLKIKLPSYISKVEIKDYDMLMKNGLKIKGEPKVTTENGVQVISIELEGTQQEYTINAEYKGTIVVLNTDLTVKTLTPSNENKMTMEFTNANEMSTNKTGTVEAKVNFVAPTGVVAANGISNYADGSKNVMSISEQSATAEIKPYAEKKTATIYGKLVNNYANKIGDIVILGRLPVKDNKRIGTMESLNSTFSTTLVSHVVLTGIDASKYTVYYSEDVDATADLSKANNGWSTTATKAAKSYLIVTEDYEMPASSTIDFSYDVEIPANLKQNNQSFEMYEVYYNNISSIGTIAETKTSSVIGMTTGQGPELSAEVKSTVETVREGQVVKMKVAVKNTGSSTAKNVKVNVPLPKYTKFVEYGAASGFYPEDITTKTLTIGDIKAGETAEGAYYIRTNDDLTQGDTTTFPKEVINTATVTVDGLDGQMPATECKFDVQNGDIAIEIVGGMKEEYALTKGEKIQFIVNVQNISNSDTLDNTIVKVQLPEGLLYEKAEIVDNWLQDDRITDGITYDTTSNILIIKLGILQKYKGIDILAKVVEPKGNVSIKATAQAEGTEEHYSNIIEHILETVQLEVSELTSTPRYIKEGEDVAYSVTIKNTGNLRVNVKVNDILPEELEFVSVTSGTPAADNRNNITSSFILNVGESKTVSVIGKARLLSDKNDKEIKNKMTVSANGFNTVETNTVTNIIEYNSEVHKDDENPSDPTTSGPKIAGTAWLDSNKNGRRDVGEEVLSNISVMLLNKKDNSIVKDTSTGAEKRTTTDSSGKYEFNNLASGEYIVIFVYDASRYSITTYKAKDVDESLNSDAIDMNMTIDGNRTIVGATDAIKLNKENVRDIDIGLYTSEKFDLKLDKYVSKITLTTPTIGTKTYTYNNSKLAKTEVLSRNLGKSSMVIEYKIVVTNEGAIPGYAKKIVDYLPEGVGFNTELNKDWYLSDNGNVYNASLANQVINPGETKEIKLVVTKKFTEDSLGVLNNNAEIYESYNEQGLKDMDSTPGNKVAEEDDMSKADIVLSLVTGKAVMYTTIILGVMVILGFGIFEIKKRILDKKNI